MTTNPVLVTVLQNIINQIVVPDPTDTSKNLVINYQPGRSLQIIKDLIEKDNAPSQKGLKYPLFAVILPIRESRGGAFFSVVKVPRIVIMYSTKTDTGTESVLEKYSSDGVFNTILRPCYDQFLKYLSFSPDVQVQDLGNIPHTYMENPCQQPIGEGIIDYVDAIEIFNLEFTLLQTQNCI